MSCQSCAGPELALLPLITGFQHTQNTKLISDALFICYGSIMSAIRGQHINTNTNSWQHRFLQTNCGWRPERIRGHAMPKLWPCPVQIDKPQLLTSLRAASYYLDKISTWVTMGQWMDISRALFVFQPLFFVGKPSMLRRSTALMLSHGMLESRGDSRLGQGKEQHNQQTFFVTLIAEHFFRTLISQY